MGFWPHQFHFIIKGVFISSFISIMLNMIIHVWIWLAHALEDAYMHYAAFAWGMSPCVSYAFLCLILWLMNNEQKINLTMICNQFSKWVSLQAIEINDSIRLSISPSPFHSLSIHSYFSVSCRVPTSKDIWSYCFQWEANDNKWEGNIVQKASVMNNACDVAEAFSFVAICLSLEAIGSNILRGRYSTGDGKIAVYRETVKGRGRDREPDWVINFNSL